MDKLVNMKNLTESYKEIILSEKESRVKRLRDRIKKGAKNLVDKKRKFWKDAWAD